MAAKFAWLAITSVPVAVVINDCIIGVDIIRNQNGGAGMRAFGGGAPETAIVLSRKWMTYKFAPLKMGDHVVVLYVIRNTFSIRALVSYSDVVTSCPNPRGCHQILVFLAA